MSGPQNAIVSDAEEPTVMPETQVPEDVLADEKKLAQYSKTKEYKRFKEFMQNRIKFYQRFLPNGSLVEGDPKDDRPMKVNLPQGVSAEMMHAYWIAACIVTKEFENVLNEYDRAREVVDNAERQS